MRPYVSRPHWQRRLAASVVGLFAWSAVLAVPAQALAHPGKERKLGVRSLNLAEMQRISGRQRPAAPMALAVDAASGSTYPWEASVGGTNTGNGNKAFQVPLVGWIARGGMPVAFTLTHNSQSSRNSELGQKWTHSYDLYLVASTGSGGSPGGIAPEGGSSTTTDLTAHWGDDLAYKFTQNVDGSYSAPTGIHDTLVANTDGTYTITKPDQTKYHYTSAYYGDTITDHNGNQVALAYNTAHNVTTITDPSSRTISLAYCTFRRI